MKTHMKNVVSRLSVAQSTWITPHVVSCSYVTETHHAHATKHETTVVQADSHSYGSVSTTFQVACHMFEEMSDLTVASATTIIGGFAKRHCHEDAIYLFSRMLASIIRPNEFTFGTVLHSSTAIGNVLVGRQLHACAMKIGLGCNVFVGSALLDLYVKLSNIEEAQKAFRDTQHPNVVSYTTLICGYLKRGRFEDALRVFHEMPEKNVVSWNAMVGGCSQTGHNEEAVNFFIDMLKEGFIPNESTFPCVICAAANIASLGIGKSFHACAIKFLGKLDGFVGNSLISFYAKCGNMEDSLLMFDKLFKRNIVSWNAVICGYAQNGRGNEAISFFKRMGSTGCKPNEVTLLGLLWACNHAGLVDEGYSYFNQARLESPSLLKPEHYACMVDLLARSGRFTEAECFLHSVPFDPGIGFWKAILGGCQIHSNKELGELAARKILALDPDDVSSYVMLSNAHSAAGRWSDVSKLRTEMKEKGMKRIPGSSWIEIRGKVHVFLTADQNHDEIYVLLRYFFEHLRENEASNLLNIFLHCSV
ncbi:pentatricopeptide repeat-containing protein At5g42450, mitochondrial-like isoform X1 [Gastrolobium bilobum]|uniref:pentatricopeptide repeat-containing protein At5g42450, mitochondrial-like isoform X1 n=1 Tax=Gastrolobium bilobum TaxID=150636 RepID=UPI002AB19E7F|nr:pentatricopeptide repeat-containing protein At5g42450, mitochondrial-like isoform X1 [Gastrolobium bilobum]